MIAKNSMAFTLPIPFIWVKLLKLKFSIEYSSINFNKSKAKTLAERFLVPVFRIIANNSSLAKLSLP